MKFYIMFIQNTRWVVGTQGKWKPIDILFQFQMSHDYQASAIHIHVLWKRFGYRCSIYSQQMIWIICYRRNFNNYPHHLQMVINKVFKINFILINTSSPSGWIQVAWDKVQLPLNRIGIIFFISFRFLDDIKWWKQS